MTFRKFLASRKPRYDAPGDFMRMAQSHEDLPEVTTWSQLRAYMEAKGTPPRVLEAGEDVWADYHKALKARTPVA